MTRHGLAFIKGHQETGVITTAKHFPGHGDTDKLKQWLEEQIEGDIHIGAIKLVCNLVSGEIRQFKTLYNPMKTLREYLVILRGKTASMFSFCCWGATIVSGASDTKITNQMKRFGRQFGLAFQIADDIHDREPFNNSIELSSKIGNYYKKSSRQILLSIERSMYRDALLRLIETLEINDSL